MAKDPIPHCKICNSMDHGANFHVSRSVDRRGAFEPTPQKKAKAWLETEAYIERHPAERAVLEAATERFYGVRVGIDF